MSRPPYLSTLVEIILSTAREDRAARVQSGTEQELAWLSLVPNPDHRALAQRVIDKPAPETK